MTAQLLPKVLAKSSGETLDEHTGHVITKFGELVQRAPQLPELLGLEASRFWNEVFWACLLHDFGKAAKGFQDMVKGQRRDWNGQRHEVLSLAFVNWVLPELHPDFAWVVAGIASHHKDAAYILEGYLSDEDEHSLPGLEELVQELDEAVIAGLLDILKVRPPEWLKHYNLHGLGIELPTNLPVSFNKKQFSLAILRALKAYNKLFKRLERLPPESLENRQAIALRGMVLLADRMASANTPKITVADLPDEAKLFGEHGREPRSHQRTAAQTDGSLVLDAPTGSGKTEAALLWAERQQRTTGRYAPLIYLLPYQASMNAMKKRLERDLGLSPDEVGLLHGRSAQVIFRRMILEQGCDAKDAAKAARRSQNLAKLYQPPVLVATPYQLLRAAYRLPGYEMLWTTLIGARLIVDEIHAYEPKRLGLFLGLLEELRQHWRVEVCAMTATMPDWLRSLLKQKIGGFNPKADPALFKAFQRHQLQILPGKLTESATLDLAEAEIRAGRSVLLCANTVKTARQTCELLRSRLDSDQVLLLHSRFTGRDRSRWEGEIMARLDANKTEREALAVVATQVIEVSLDLDFDTIITEPAPLEALAQRFGRVNRRPKSDSAGQPIIKPVRVLTEAADNGDIYNAGLVRNTLKLLTREAGALIDEAVLSGWLDEIYGVELAQVFSDEVSQALNLFKQSCLKGLRAFSSDSTLKEEFDELFDGTEVLPLSLLSEYREKAEQTVLEAANLLVPISFDQLRTQKRYGKIRFDSELGLFLADLPYSEKTGLEL